MISAVHATKPSLQFRAPIPSEIISSMLSYPVRVLIRINQRWRRRLSCLPGQTHSDFRQNPSIYLSCSPLQLNFSCGSFAGGVNLINASSTRSLPSGFRSDHTMASPSQKPQSVHDFTVKDAKGNDVDLSLYKGKVLVIVNVASECGLTNSNYTELSKLYEKYKDQGLEILAFPCNQFGGQEPGNNEQIMEFACTRFKAEFPIFDKVDVNGDNAAPIYKFLKSTKGELLGQGIKWNFAKFLVDKDGKVVDRYAPTTSPLSIEKDIKKLLGIA